MGDDIPQWAKERACELANAEGDDLYSCSDAPCFARYDDGGAKNQALFALAKVIAAHEEPPVDPLLIEARKLLAEDHLYHGFDFFDHGVLCKAGAGNEVIMAGKLDGNVQLARYHVALRRGMELAGQP